MVHFQRLASSHLHFLVVRHFISSAPTCALSGGNFCQWVPTSHTRWLPSFVLWWPIWIFSQALQASNLVSLPRFPRSVFYLKSIRSCTGDYKEGRRKIVGWLELNFFPYGSLVNDKGSFGSLPAEEEAYRHSRHRTQEFLARPAGLQLFPL